MFMSLTTPVTQRDLAQACGVHPSTICLALNNAPSIPLPTRRRIQATARKLGYQPNAAARNLAFMRNERRPGASLPMAWINQEATRDFWRRDVGARQHYDGASRRATELGYHLEEFWVHEPGMSLGRLAQIIRARGIECVMFPIYRAMDPALFQPAWNEFSCVAFNDHRAGDWLDVVCPDYYYNTALALDRLRRGGFERVGLVLTEAFDQATNGLVHSRYLRQQDELAPARRLSACKLPASGADAGRFEAWRDEARPDAVLCCDGEIGRQLELLAPDVVVAQLRVTARETCEGIDELAADVAATATSCLADKVRRFEKGIGSSMRQHLVKGAWREAPAGVQRLRVCPEAAGLLAS